MRPVTAALTMRDQDTASPTGQRMQARVAAPGAFAAVGELVAVEDGQRFICHECGRAFASLGSHVRKHQLTAGQYRELHGLNRQASLDAPALQQRQREVGLVRYAGSKPLREGLTVGMAMASNGELLRLSHAAQPPGSARPQARQRYRRSTEPTRQQASQAAAQRHAARLGELGFAGDLPGYLLDAYQVRHLPVLAVARELRVGNEAIQQMLKDAGIDRRPPGASNRPEGGVLNLSSPAADNTSAPEKAANA